MNENLAHATPRADTGFDRVRDCMRFYGHCGTRSMPHQQEKNL